MGLLTNYLALIGLETYSGSTSPVRSFISQIAFYIMAVVLEDYFSERLNKLEHIDCGHKTHLHTSKSIVNANG